VITVAEYDPAWPERFARLRDEYAQALAAAGVPVVAIEHVGSTSVPGLAAKPIIDCDIVVEGEHVAAASQVLAGLGFTPLGDLGIPLRWAFSEPERLAGTNTYVIVAGSLSLRNHLAVRDALRADPDLRDRYAAVKRRVGAVAADIYEYGQGKNAMVQEILAATDRLTEDERAAVNPPVLIRKLRPADYPVVLSVLDTWWGGRHMADMLPRLFFEHFTHTSFAAERDGELSGFLVGFRSQSHPAETYIHFVGVAPEERGSGLGRRLYERFFSTVQAQGCTLVRAVTAPVNESSVRFHRQLGFTIEPGDAEVGGIAVTTAYDGPGQDRVRFVRSLLRAGGAETTRSGPDRRARQGGKSDHHGRLPRQVHPAITSTRRLGRVPRGQPAARRAQARSDRLDRNVDHADVELDYREAKGERRQHQPARPGPLRPRGGLAKFRSLQASTLGTGHFDPVRSDSDSHSDSERHPSPDPITIINPHEIISNHIQKDISENPRLLDK
jgi:GrpB-like predicted nucleotidyltransferase (UPF0157 family)/predicted GNAT superfamily acetyltransferase